MGDRWIAGTLHGRSGSLPPAPVGRPGRGRSTHVDELAATVRRYRPPARLLALFGAHTGDGEDRLVADRWTDLVEAFREERGDERDIE
jgi:hypothetical protein